MSLVDYLESANTRMCFLSVEIVILLEISKITIKFQPHHTPTRFRITSIGQTQSCCMVHTDAAVVSGRQMISKHICLLAYDTPCHNRT